MLKHGSVARDKEVRSSYPFVNLSWESPPRTSSWGG